MSNNILRWCLLDMSGYVLSVHKTSQAATDAKLKEWQKNKTKQKAWI